MHPFHTQVLTAAYSGDQVLLSYRLGMADSFTLLSRRGTESDYSIVAEDEASPIIDGRPKLDPGGPELRYYCAILGYPSGKCQRSEAIQCEMP